MSATSQPLCFIFSLRMYSIFITWGLGIISTYQTVLTLIKADVIVGPGPGWQLCEKVIGCENLLYCATLIDNDF